MKKVPWCQGENLPGGGLGESRESNWWDTRPEPVCPVAPTV